jgi:hypothetical protein
MRRSVVTRRACRSRLFLRMILRAGSSTGRAGCAGRVRGSLAVAGAAAIRAWRAVNPARVAADRGRKP